MAVVSTLAEVFALYAVWRWVLPEFDVRVPVWVLIVVMVAWAVFGVVNFIFVTRLLKRKTLVGLPNMVGMRGKVRSPLSPEGQVMIKGELWGAKSVDGDIDVGEMVVVVGQDSLQLIVRRAGSLKAPGDGTIR